MTVWEYGKKLPLSPRVICGLSQALEVEEKVLRLYLQGRLDIESLPTPMSQMRAALPDAWVEALFPIAFTEQEDTVTEVLIVIQDKVLDEERNYDSG